MKKNIVSQNIGSVLIIFLKNTFILAGLCAAGIMIMYLLFAYIRWNIYEAKRIPIEDAQRTITYISNHQFNGQLHPMVSVVAGAHGGGGDKSQYYLLEHKEEVTLDGIIQTFNNCQITGSTCRVEEDEPYDGPYRESNPYRTAPDWWFYQADNILMKHYRCTCGDYFYKELSVILGQNSVYLKFGNFEGSILF